jgi:hypothetical protein
VVVRKEKDRVGGVGEREKEREEGEERRKINGSRQTKNLRKGH